MSRTPAAIRDGWLNYNDDDDAGVGGYDPVLRYAAVPSSGGGTGLDEAIAAPILALANLPGESDANKYCAVASAVDLLGNQSALPNAEDHADDAGTCMEAGLTYIAAANGNDARPATDYELLLKTLADAEDANVEDDVTAAKKALANAGILVGVDITPPAVEFTAGGSADEATTLETGWVLYVTDGRSGLATDPIDASIEVRDAKGTKDVKQADANTILPKTANLRSVAKQRS